MASSRSVLSVPADHLECQTVSSESRFNSRGAGRPRSGLRRHVTRDNAASRYVTWTDRPDMATFILLSTLTDDGAQTLMNDPERILEVNAELANMGVRVISQFAVLGMYDFVNIVEAP